MVLLISSKLSNPAKKADTLQYPMRLLFRILLACYGLFLENSDLTKGIVIVLLLNTPINYNESLRANILISKILVIKFKMEYLSEA